MAILNPNKYIRTAYINALEATTGLKVWHKKVPLTTKPMPKRYILLDSQTKNEFAKTKCKFDWSCTIDVNIYNVNAPGYSDAEVVDDIEQIVMSLVLPGLAIPNFINKRTEILESLDLSVDTNTNSIDRRLIKFDHWLSNTQTSEGLLYFGTGTPTTIEQIFQGSSSAYNQSQDIIVPFNNVDYEMNWFWLPFTENLPTNYVRLSDPNDTGVLGSVDGLFAVGVVIGGGVLFAGNYPIPLTESYRMY